MEYKSYQIEVAPTGYKIYPSHEAWMKDEEPLHVAESMVEAKMWIDQSPLEKIKPYFCIGCGQEVLEVVASFAVLGYNEATREYDIVKDVGDFSCPKCGKALAITRFYPPEEEGTPG